MYTVYAKWVTGLVEEIDEAENKEEAKYLEREYRFAFGKHCLSIWSVKQKAPQVCGEAA